MAFAKSAKRGLALLGSAAMMVGFAAPTFAAPAQTADASAKERRLSLFPVCFFKVSRTEERDDSAN